MMDCVSLYVTYSLCMQVRSYCRGIVVRAVDSETRKKLFARLQVTEMASMRSFLDTPRGHAAARTGLTCMCT